MRSSNKNLILRMIEALNSGEYASIEPLYAPDCSGNTPDGPLQGWPEYAAFFEKYRRAFSGRRIEVNSILAEEDAVVVHYTFVGTNTRALAGAPPTGRQMRLPGVMLLRMHKGRISEQSFIWDNLGPRRQVWLATVVERQFATSDHAPSTGSRCR